MVYGPVAAFLVELFPTRIRYTSMSLPYHIGFGVFGGLTPFIATALYESSKTEAAPVGDPFAGLWHPIIVPTDFAAPVPERVTFAASALATPAVAVPPIAPDFGPEFETFTRSSVVDNTITFTTAV